MPSVALQTIEKIFRHIARFNFREAKLEKSKATDLLIGIAIIKK